MRTQFGNIHQRYTCEPPQIHRSQGNQFHLLGNLFSGSNEQIVEQWSWSCCCVQTHCLDWCDGFGLPSPPACNPVKLTRSGENKSRSMSCHTWQFPHLYPLIKVVSQPHQLDTSSLQSHHGLLKVYKSGLMCWCRNLVKSSTNIFHCFVVSK